jgi:hypothetical protein
VRGLPVGEHDEPENNMNVPDPHQRSLHDVVRRVAPDLPIASSSQPVPVLRTHNVVALAETPEKGRDAVLALESLEYDDDKLGTVVMTQSSDTETAEAGIDPEGVSRQVMPRVVIGALIGALAGFLLVGGGALLFGVTGWRAAGAALGGAMMLAVFGAIWVTFAGPGGSDAYRQTFVEEMTTDVALVSLHTDDAAEADAARRVLEARDISRVFVVDASGHRLS